MQGAHLTLKPPGEGDNRWTVKQVRDHAAPVGGKGQLPFEWHYGPTEVRL
jgi:hypothetical protein